jgi:hypothetical protein
MRRAAQLKLLYDTQPNKLNPLKAWPMRASSSPSPTCGRSTLSCPTATPEHKTRGLFAKLFGFDTCGRGAYKEDFFCASETYAVPHRGEFVACMNVNLNVLDLEGTLGHPRATTQSRGPQRLWTGAQVTGAVGTAHNRRQHPW